MSDTVPENSTAKNEANQNQSLEVLFSTALAGFAALVKHDALRTILALLAPPTGYTIVKLGRWIVNYWIPRWTTDTPESLTKRYISDAEKKLKKKNISGAEKKQLQEHVKQLREALHQHRLKQLETTPSNSSSISSTSSGQP